MEVFPEDTSRKTLEDKLQGVHPLGEIQPSFTILLHTVGSAAVKISGQTAEILWLTVLAPSRKQGNGTELLAEILAQLAERRFHGKLTHRLETNNEEGLYFALSKEFTARSEGTHILLQKSCP